MTSSSGLVSGSGVSGVLHFRLTVPRSSLSYSQSDESIVL